jgi:ComF family protein
MFKALRNSISSVLFPIQCGSCARQVEDLDDGAACATCWSETRIFSGSELLCRHCGALLEGANPNIDVSCHKCDGHFYDRAAAAGVYEKALAATVICLKSQPKLGRRAADFFLEAFYRSTFQDSTLIVPVPLAKKRRQERGYNQAEVLGQILSRETGIKLDRHSLSRILHSPIHRVAMDAKARELSVRNAFAVERPALIDRQSILMVDDVFTSGATASNCAKILKKNGAASVNILTLARAVYIR